MAMIICESDKRRFVLKLEASVFKMYFIRFIPRFFLFTSGSRYESEGVFLVTLVVVACKNVEKFPCSFPSFLILLNFEYQINTISWIFVAWI